MQERIVLFIKIWRNKTLIIFMKLNLKDFSGFATNCTQIYLHTINNMHSLYSYLFYRRDIFHLDICTFYYYHTLRCILQNIWSQNTLLHVIHRYNSIFDRHKINLYIQYLLSLSSTCNIVVSYQLKHHNWICLYVKASNFSNSSLHRELCVFAYVGFK